MSTTAAVLSIVGAGLLGWFGGFVLGFMNWKPPRRLIWANVLVRVADSGTDLLSQTVKLDPLAVYRPAAYQAEIDPPEEAGPVILDIWLREAE